MNLKNCRFNVSICNVIITSENLFNSGDCRFGQQFSKILREIDSDPQSQRNFCRTFFSFVLKKILIETPVGNST